MNSLACLPALSRCKQATSVDTFIKQYDAASL